MKTIIVTFYQENQSITQSFELTKANRSKVLGTALYKLFRWLDVSRQMGSKSLKLNQPINIKIETDTFSIDTGKAHTALTQRLKVQMNKKHVFSARFKALYDFMTEEAKEFKLSEMTEGELVESALSSVN